jgi:hypothetical protein
MKFARRNLGLFAPLRSSVQVRRPRRALRPALGMERFEERTLLSIALVSVNATGTSSANSDSDFSATSLDSSTNNASWLQSKPVNLSSDGTKLVFVSDGPDLGGSVSEAYPSSNVFVRGTATGVTSLVSVASGGQPGNDNSFDPVISPNGQYVAFVSLATNLTAAAGQSSSPDLTGVGNLYVRDLQTGTTTLLDQTPGGQAPDGLSTGQFVFSPDSTTLAWLDSSDNLTTATIDPLSQSSTLGSPAYVYVRDLATQTTSLVSASPSGQASGSIADTVTTDLVFSPDSKSVVFGSTATDLTANASDNTPNPYAAYGATSPENLFLRNLAAGTTTLLSVTTSGLLDVQGDSFNAVFSPDGKSVAFSSDVTVLTANGANFTPPASADTPLTSFPPQNIFIRDLTTATTTLVTATPNGLQSSGLAGGLVFSPDGSELAFASSGTDLTTNTPDPNPAPNSAADPAAAAFGISGFNVFVRDLATGNTKLVSATPSGMLSNGLSANQVIFSPNGQYIAFTSGAGDLTNNAFDITPPTAFGTAAPTTDAAQGSLSNVFISNLVTGATTLASATTTGLLANDNTGGLIFSPNSESLFYWSDATDLTSNPPQTSAASSSNPNPVGVNLFAYDLPTATTSLLSATPSGQLSDSNATNITFLSSDGKSLYYDSNATTLTAGASNPNQSTQILAASAPFTIANQIQFQSWESSAQETDGSIVVTVLRSSPATTAASVNYAVENGTATAGTDFAATSGTLNFAAGQASQTFTIPLISADRFSGTRSAELVLSNPHGASLGYPSATLNLTAQSPASTPVSPAPTPQSTPQPGPTVMSVAPIKSHQGKTRLVITFNQALDSATAQNVGNYQVTLPGRALHVGRRHLTAASPRRPVRIAKVAYDPTTHQVTLTLKTKLPHGHASQIQINGAAGGLAATDGTPLNSPDARKPGADYVAAL